MSFQFTHPWFLACAAFAVPWLFFYSYHSDIQIARWRHRSVLALRLLITLCIILALAGLQQLRPLEGMNVVYLLDRSESIPVIQKEDALHYVQQTMSNMEQEDMAGVVVFGGEAALELPIIRRNELPTVQSVIDESRTDIGAAIRLATAAFPEQGQKRMVLLTDGNENIGSALPALRSALPMNVTMDVYPMLAQRGQDVSVQRIGIPSLLKEGTAFEAKIFAQADKAEAATLRLFINDQLVVEQNISMEPGKNLFTVPQMLSAPGFYTYDVQLIAKGDSVAQNNRAIGFTTVRGDPRLLLVSDNIDADTHLIEALESSKLKVLAKPVSGLPESLPELQSFDSIILSNVAAGDLSRQQMQLLQSAVRDFGVGLICIGGDQSFAAGGYKGTPLETCLPLEMELSSKKVMPNGALAMVMHGMEFNNGNQIARQVASGVMHTMAAQDELGIVLWDGTEKWLFPLTPVGDKQDLGRKIMGMNQGDLPSFQSIMEMAFEGLQKSEAQLRHMIIFSDGDPGAPSKDLLDKMVSEKITVSTILIAGHAGPETMKWIAQNGNGRFYEVQNPADLPQIFMKEASVILKSAIVEHPFAPRVLTPSEPIRGLAPVAYPLLQGYVGSSAKPRAEVPLISDQGDPILAHWQYGLGRALAFTSDARPKWAHAWIAWSQFRPFWTQIARWSLRRVEKSDFTTEVSIEKGIGSLSIEAVDINGNFRNFLDLRTRIISPSGSRQEINLNQTSPGRYEVSFPAREIGAYTLNVGEYEAGELQGMQVVGANVNFSPEYLSPETNMYLLSRLTEEGRGKLIDPDDPDDNPYERNRQRTLKAGDLWPWLLMTGVLLFPIDVGLRRIRLEGDEMRLAWLWLSQHIPFKSSGQMRPNQEEAIETLLRRRKEKRSTRMDFSGGTAYDPLLERADHDRNEMGQEWSREKPSPQPSDGKDESTLEASETAENKVEESVASRLLRAKRKNKHSPE
ncbi:MAG: VWA domain-containing protein [Verrucomicrobiota bacterium]|nr:VWA domain-containing protein [Verrucomicrobiota bacterium]